MSFRFRAFEYACMMLPVLAWLCLAEAGAARADEKVDPKTPAGSFEPCVKRFLAPFESLSLPASVGKSDSSEKAVSQDAGDFTRSILVPKVKEVASALRESLRTSAIDNPTEIEVVIASIPDPVESGLVHQYETTLAALRTGVEYSVTGNSENKKPDSLYIREGTYLPWLTAPGQTAAKTEEAEKCASLLPGLLLFRSGASLDKPDQQPGAQGDQPNALPPVRLGTHVFVVLLVGESPSSGPRATVLRNALSIAHALQDRRCSTETCEIDILGPMFSGSARGLRSALYQFAESMQGQSLYFNVISGTASAPSLPDQLRPPGDRLSASSAMKFSATVGSEADTRCNYLTFLAERLGVTKDRAGSQTGELAEVAELSELGSFYGDSLRVRDADQPTCRYRPGLSLAFPMNLSNLRDAYQSLDSATAGDDRRLSPLRATTLSASLAEGLHGKDIEANHSEKTRASLDVTLSHLLREVARRGIKHVAIHATEVGDAIFLARKLRDVAPDMHLAFFTTDELMFHPDFASMLHGSLVVGAYPFLGAPTLRVIDPHPVQERLKNINSPKDPTPALRAFPNGYAQGIFNAMLALRGAPPEALLDYNFASANIPTWISTIASGGLQPLDVMPLQDGKGVVFGGSWTDNRVDSAAPRDRLRTALLVVDPVWPWPWMWHVIITGLVVSFLADGLRQARAAARLAKDPMPHSLAGANGTNGLLDSEADRAIGRTKWWLYAAIRSYLFAVVLGYLTVVYTLAWVARGHPFDPGGVFHLAICCTLLVITMLAFRRVRQSVRQFRYDYKAFARFVDEHPLPVSLSDLKRGIRRGRISVPHAADVAHGGEHADNVKLSSRPPVSRWPTLLGLSEPVTRTEAARISFAQLRNIVVVACLLGFSAAVLLAAMIVIDVDARHSLGVMPIPLLSLNVQRTLYVLDGVSIAPPLLLSAACVYAWVVGRMHRVSLAHTLSRMAPPDGESDLVSTPLALILYPPRADGSERADEGYTASERDVLNAIWRPATGRQYTSALVLIMLFTALVFLVKPLSTLESRPGTWLMATLLGLTAVLIGVTVIQQVQFSNCLDRLLRRTMTHPISPAFREAPAYVRDSIDRQLSRSHDGLLRWAACAGQFAELAASFPRRHGVLLTEQNGNWLRNQSTTLLGLRARAMAAADAPKLTHEDESAGTEEVTLAREVISSAAEVTRMAQTVWETRALELFVRQALQSDAALEANTAERWEGRIAVGDDSATTGTVRATGVRPPKPTATPASSESTGPVAVAKPGNDFRIGQDPLNSVAAHFSADELQWLRNARIFVVTVVTMLLHRHVRQFRYFASTLIACCVMLLLALISYPFEPYRLLLTCVWVIVLAVAGTSAWTYLRLHRNTLLSTIAGTAPNHLTVTGASVLRLITWVGLPLFSVAAAQYPELARLFWNVLAPFVHALR